MPIDTIAARNKRIKELEAEVADARYEAEQRLAQATLSAKRAEAAEARVAELERENGRIGHRAYRQGELGAHQHYSAKLAAADRLAEAMRNLKTLALESTDPGIDGTWVRHEDLLEALAAFDPDSGCPGHPPRDREDD